MVDFAAGAREYLAKLQDVLARLDVEEIAAVAKIFRDAYDRGNTIFLMGNGGKDGYGGPEEFPRHRVELPAGFPSQGREGLLGGEPRAIGPVPGHRRARHRQHPRPVGQ